MATINLGNIKFTWKGAYNAGTAYAIDDVVSYNGNTYALGYYSENLALNTNCSATSNNLASTASG